MRQIDLSAPNPLSCKRGVRKSITRIACRFLRGIFVKSDRLLETMDALSHALWVGAGAAVAHRAKLIDNRTIGAIVALAALPDVIHLAPIVAWAP